MFACIHTPDARALARSFSPWVETVDEKTAVFSITPRQIAEKTLERIPHAQVAVAETVEAAILAARNFPGLTFLEPGDEARVLGSLPVDCLPPDPEIFQMFDLWGIRSLADFARLPENGVAERLGPRGLWMQRLARGALSRPLRPAIPAANYEESTELDYPLDRIEPLLFLIGRFLYDLCARLEAQSLASEALQLTLNDQERMLRLPFPTRDIKFLLKLVEHDIEARPLEEPVERVRLVILPTEPRRVQHGLFAPAAPEPERLELTLGKIRALVGEKNVKTPELRNTYRPGWSVSDSRLAFRYFRPPLEARVETKAGIPKKLWTRVCRGEISKIAGPWRTSGDWWRPDAWNRDEWDLELADGALYRIYRDGERWFVEGTYD
jgi:protein ImuB